MSASAVVPNWMGYKWVVCDVLPPDVWCLVSGTTLYVARCRQGLFVSAFPGMLPQADERFLVPDLDSPRDAAPEGWR